MTGKTHLLGGAVAGLCVVTTNEITAVSIVAFSLSLAGSIMPDIDIETSAISKVLRPIHKVYKLLFGPFKCGAHRGITHSLPMAFTFSYLLYLIDPIYGFSILYGIVSHLFLDLISGGEALLAPFTNKRIRLGDIKTGQIGEVAIAFCEILLIACLIIKRGGVMYH